MTRKLYLSQGMGWLFVILCISILLTACGDRSTAVPKIKGEEWGKYDAYKSCWETINETIHQTAEEHNIPVAEVYTVFNGPTHDEDPMGKGYLRPDGEHPSETGAKVIAEAFRKLGYDPIIP